MIPGSKVILQVVLITLISGHAFGQDAVVVKVLDKRKSPVISTIFLNPGKHQLGKTTPTGEFKFTHKCGLGQTFKAEPVDRAKYYDSEEQVCGKLVELAVFPRPQNVVNATELAMVRALDAGDGADAAVYAGIFSGVAEKVEPIAGGQQARCRYTLDSKYAFGIYNPKTDRWKNLEDPNLVPTDPKPKSVYIFPTSCEVASPQILELKTQAAINVKLTAKRFSVSSEFGSAAAKAVKRMKLP